MDALLDKLEDAFILVEDADVSNVELKLVILERQCPDSWYEYVKDTVFVYVSTVFALYGIQRIPKITYRIVSLSEYKELKNKLFNEALYEVHNYD